MFDQQVKHPNQSLSEGHNKRNNSFGDATQPCLPTQGNWLVCEGLTYLEMF